MEKISITSHNILIFCFHRAFVNIYTVQT